MRGNPQTGLVEGNRTPHVPVDNRLGYCSLPGRQRIGIPAGNFGDSRAVDGFRVGSHAAAGFRAVCGGDSGDFCHAEELRALRGFRSSASSQPRWIGLPRPGRCKTGMKKIFGRSSINLGR